MSSRVKCCHKESVLFWSKRVGNKFEMVAVHRRNGSKCDTRTIKTLRGIRPLGDFADAFHQPELERPGAQAFLHSWRHQRNPWVLERQS